MKEWENERDFHLFWPSSSVIESTVSRNNLERLFFIVLQCEMQTAACYQAIINHHKKTTKNPKTNKQTVWFMNNFKWWAGSWFRRLESNEFLQCMWIRIYQSNVTFFQVDTTDRKPLNRPAYRVVSECNECNVSPCIRMGCQIICSHVHGRADQCVEECRNIGSAY